MQDGKVLNAMRKTPPESEVPGHPGDEPLDEFDVDLTLDEDTCEEVAECLGQYPSLDDYYRGQLEELLVASGQWLLECLDMKMVRRRFESGRYRYFVHRGRVYRTGV